MTKKIEKINVIGLGYVGQTLAVTLAEAGFTVYGSDVSENVLKALNSGYSTVREPGINELIQKHLGKYFFPGIQETVYQHQTDAFIICVGSPIDKKTKKPVLDSVKNIINDIKNHLYPGQTVILRSTVPIGTTRNFVKPVLEESGFKAGIDFALAFAPERTVEGDALRELRVLPQIIGGINEKSVEQARAIFRRTTSTIIPVSSLEAAEAVKLLDNSYRDVRFAYANEIARYFEKTNLNAFEIIKAAGQGYPRNSIPLPSPGVGGACLSKDPYIFIKCAEEVSEKMELVAHARKINEAVPSLIIKRLKEIAPLKDRKVFIIGFAFKGQPETNDIRESPTLDLVELLKQEGVILSGFDPCVEDWKIRELGVKYTSRLKDGIRDADIIIFMTNHPSFYRLKATELIHRMKTGATLFDGWGLFNSRDFQASGINYRGIGIG